MELGTYEEEEEITTPLLSPPDSPRRDPRFLRHPRQLGAPQTQHQDLHRQLAIREWEPKQHGLFVYISDLIYYRFFAYVPFLLWMWRASVVRP